MTSGSPTSYADLKIYLIHDLENGSLGFKTHLCDHPGVFTHNRYGRGCAVERQSFKVHSLNLVKSEPDHSSSKSKTPTASFSIQQHGRARNESNYKGPLNKHV